MLFHLQQIFHSIASLHLRHSIFNLDKYLRLVAVYNSYEHFTHSVCNVVNSSNVPLLIVVTLLSCKLLTKKFYAFKKPKTPKAYVLVL